MKTAGITGAGDGIGRAIAKALADEGIRVVVTDRDMTKAQETRDEIKARGGAAAAIELDVVNMAQAAKAVGQIAKDFGRIDIWVNNAGVSSMKKFVDLTEADWDFNMNVNAKGTFICGQAAAQHMLTQDRDERGRRGKIINLASVAGKTGKVQFLSHYIASKFAVVGLTQAMARELAPDGITVNAVCPGYVRTKMQAREIAWEGELRGLTSEQVTKLYLDDTPLGRLEEPQDVADIVTFLVSDRSDFMTGISLTVSGGAWME